MSGHEVGVGPAAVGARVRGWCARASAALRVAPSLPPRSRWLRPLVDGSFLLIMVAVVQLAFPAEEFPPPALLCFILAGWLPLLVRYRAPAAALAGTVAMESLHLLLMPILLPDLHAQDSVALYQPVPLATMVAAYALASRNRPGGWIAGVVAASVLLLAALVSHPVELLGTDMVMFNLVLLAVGAGAAVQTRRSRVERSERLRREHVESQVAAERLRIARDLHDVLAHHLTLVNAQVGVASYLVSTNPAAAGRALAGIGQHTRDALQELRATVGLLRQSGDLSEGENRTPVADLSELGRLVEGFRTAGADVTLSTSGRRGELMPSTDLAAYRIVQESLTNAMKHAPGSPVALEINWASEHLHITVRNGPGTKQRTVRRSQGSGNGLIGMQERARSCSGSVQARPTSDGGFLVMAVLPVRPHPGSSAS